MAIATPSSLGLSWNALQIATFLEWLAIDPFTTSVYNWVVSQSTGQRVTAAIFTSSWTVVKFFFARTACAAIPGTPQNKVMGCEVKTVGIF